VVVVVLVAGGLWAYEASLGVETTHEWITEGSLARVLAGVTIVQLSDVHIGRLSVGKADILDTLQSLNPDVVVLTGDYVTWNGDYAAAIEFLSSVRAQKGVYAVMGDYDYSNSRKSCLFCHEPGSGKPARAHQVRFLRNWCEDVIMSAGNVAICGVDSGGLEEALSPDEMRGIEGKINGRPAIILSHTPLILDHVDDRREALILAGDTHGGQIPLPRWLWGLLGYEKNAKYEQGWFTKGKIKMYVNRGIGTSHLPIRVFRTPEITVFHFGPRA
jgi:uncharacterized protein